MLQAGTPMEEPAGVEPLKVDGYENVFDLQTVKATEMKSFTF